MKTYYEKVVEMCRDALLKQLHDMVHTNGYPTEAVAKSTILSLPALMRTELESIPVPSVASPEAGGEGKFAEWAANKHWHYHSKHKIWVDGLGYDRKTTAELYSIYQSEIKTKSK